MSINFHKLLLSELHMVVYRPGGDTGLNDRLLCEAVTVNENLRSLGFVLKPPDLIRLAASPDLHGFCHKLRDLVPSVKAEPMYPGFPQQVMEMSEAQFRLHQAIHYFSTYDLELLTGQEVSRGWLPACSGPDRIKEDTLLMDAAVIELLSAQDAAITVLKILLGRRERLTNPELDLVTEAAAICTAEQMKDVKIRFKENLELLFPLLMELPDRETALRTLQTICAHTGDVLRCTAAYLSRKKYHLRTSEKKLLVKLLECYPVENLRQNLIRSSRAREQHLTVLKHLDYNLYSRSPEHREAVRALRNAELLSWHGTGEQLLTRRSPGALAHLAQRPGYMVRMLNRLLSLDYSREEVLEALRPRADAVSSHLILKALRTLAGRESRILQSHQAAVRSCTLRFEQARTACQPASIVQEYCGKVRNVKYRASCIRMRLCDSRLESQILRLRETVQARLSEPEAAVIRQREVLSRLHRTLQQQKLHQGRYVLTRNAHSDFDPDILLSCINPDYFPQRIAEAEVRLHILEEQLKKAQAEADVWQEQQLQLMTQQRAQAAERLATVDFWEQEQLEKLEQKQQEALTSAADMLRVLQAQEQSEMDALEKVHQRQLRICGFDMESVSILKELLMEHYRRAVTPLKGRKVFCQLDQFDLAHSTLETEDRSKDGGYIRSGISYAIPKDARFVRFFVYWNDPHRVDIDLHAGGVSADGGDIHVGWNSHFRQYGVIHSGDITHSNAAEYIDIDLSAPIREISANVNLFYGKPSFREVETCYIGMMAVDRIGADVKHYNPANCFFTHELTQNTRNLFYGYVDVKDRFVRFVGQSNPRGWDARPQIESTEKMFSFLDYLTCLLDAQETEPVSTPDEAEVVLTMGKSMLENGISLVDHNFFLEC